VPVPDGLRMRLAAKLDRERDAWYRRFIATRVLPVGAAAAAVLLVVLAGWQWSISRLPVLDSDGLPVAFDERYQSTREKVNEWIRQEMGDSRLEAPSQFDYYRLENYFVSELQGKRVPTLVFLANSGKGEPRSAWVYVLGSKSFDVSKIRGSNHPVSGMFHKAKLLENPDNSHVTYFVVYNSDRLESFFAKNNDPQG
jgi:hypothetical protein